VKFACLVEWQSSERVRSSSSFAFKGTHTKSHVFAHTQKGANLTSYNKLSRGYFKQKFPKNILGTP